ncbi:MAG: BCCT family transporter [Pseudomonadota bacterium]
MTRFPYDTDHELGAKNIQILGLDVHNPVFFTSALFILLFVLGTLIAPESAGALLGNARSWTLTNAHWFFSSTILIVVLFCVGIALSPLGKIRLGGVDAKPVFGTPSWLAMLFSAGVGIGLMFWGAAEPLAYYTGWGGTPLAVPPETAAARRLAMSATVFHWGFHPWAVYAIVGLALAFFTFNKGLPLSLRSCFFPLLGERVWGWPGHVIDTLAVVATIFGLATSLGLGAIQAAAGLHYLTGIDPGIVTQVIVIAGVTTLATLSVVRGLDKGVRVLSNLNIILAIALFAFVLIAGPTSAILSAVPATAVNYIVDSFALMNWVGRPDRDWYEGWTIFYWAWWVSWCPFVGMFIARVSKGRTIREFLVAVMVLPVLVSLIWFTAFGTTAIEQATNGVGELGQGFTDASLVLFQMLDSLPAAELVSGFAVVLLLIFFVTSSDSGSLVIDTITSGGKLHAPVPQRIFWAIMEGLVAAILLFGGGSQALTALQAGTITSALPFTLVLLLITVSLFRGLVHEYVALRQRGGDSGFLRPTTREDRGSA